MTRTYVTIRGGYRAILEGRYRFIAKPGGYQKQWYVRMLGVDDAAPFPVPELHITSGVQLTLLKGGKT